MNDTIHPDEFDVPHTIAVSFPPDEWERLFQYATHHALGPVEAIRQALDALYGTPGASLVTGAPEPRAAWADAARQYGDDHPEVDVEIIEGDVPDLEPGEMSPAMKAARDEIMREFKVGGYAERFVTRHLEPTREMDTAVCATCGRGIHRLTGWGSASPPPFGWFHDQVIDGFAAHEPKPEDRRYWYVDEAGHITVGQQPEAEPVVIEGEARRTLPHAGDYERADFGSPWATKGEFEALSAKVDELGRRLTIEQDARDARREIERHIDAIGFERVLDAVRFHG